jgi:hypothetical protein
MTVKPADYNYFYNKICEAFVKKEWNGKLASGAQTVYSRKTWIKRNSATGEYLAIKLFFGRKRPNKECFYRTNLDLNKNPNTDVDEISLHKGLIYLEYDFLEKENDGGESYEEKVLLLLKRFVFETSGENKKIKTENSQLAPNLITDESFSDKTYDILTSFFRYLQERQYTNAWELVNDILTPTFPSVKEYSAFKEYYDIPIKNVFIFNGFQYGSEKITWEVFYERTALDCESFFHYMTYFPGRLDEYDRIVDAFDRAFEPSPEYRKWSMFNLDDFEFIWNDRRINKRNIARIIPTVERYYIKVFAKFEFRKVQEKWGITSIDTQKVKLNLFEIY